MHSIWKIVELFDVPFLSILDRHTIAYPRSSLEFQGVKMATPMRSRAGGSEGLVRFLREFLTCVNESAGSRSRACDEID